MAAPLFGRAAARYRDETKQRVPAHCDHVLAKLQNGELTVGEPLQIGWLANGEPKIINLTSEKNQVANPDLRVMLTDTREGATLFDKQFGVR